MGCPDADRIVRYVFRELEDSERAELEAHADSCAACRQAISELAAGSLADDGAATAGATDVEAGGAVEPGDRVGRYVILHRVGAGGMGVVFAAYDPELDRKVALKLLHDSGAGDAGARMVREARALARLSHPNVVTVHDAGTSDGRVFIAMEYIQGSTLRAWLEQEPRSWREVRKVLVAAGRGLEAAHAAGLVHRDFKPENVLIDGDGGVCVTDFGMARAAAGDARPPPGDGAQGDFESEPIDLTRSGAVLGTPAYMAPEQFRGEPADACSDQFGFCVVLYEALVGDRPFAGDTFQTLAAAVLAGELRAPARESAPRFLRDAALTGLAVDPARRHSSMTALLERLQRDPAARLRRWGAAALAVAAIVGLFALQIRGDEPRGPCGASAAGLAGVWDAPRRAELGAAFAATDRSTAAATWNRVAAELDRWTADWVAMRGEACEATHIAGDQSELLLDLRMRCLDRKLGELRALTELFASSVDGTVVDNAVQAVTSLPPIAACADVEALMARVPPPDEPQVRERVAGQRAELDRAGALLRAGKYAEGFELSSRAIEEAEKLAYRPLEAEALGLHGDLSFRLGKYGEAEEILQRAAQAAAEARDDTQSARVWTLLAGVVGYARGERERGLAYVRVAEGWVARAGGQQALRAELADIHGLILDAAGRYDEARPYYQQALDLRAKLYGPDHLEVALSLNNLAAVPYEQGKFEEAVALYQRSLEIRQRVLGPDNPEVAATLNAVAACRRGQGRLEEARELYAKALAIWIATLGPDHPDVAVAHNNLGLTLQKLGIYEDSRRHLERALVLWRAALGEDHAFVASAISNLGILCYRQGDYDCALDHMDRVLAVRERVLGAEHPDLAATLVNRGAVREKADRRRDAEQDYRRALAILERAVASDDPLLARALTMLGKLLVDDGRARAAIALLERAVEIRAGEGSEVGPAKLAASRFALARALWDSGQGRKRALRLATAARDASSDADVTGTITEWMGRHGGAGK